MPVSAVALYGSRARGDPAETSDVDILVVTSERRTRHVALGDLSIYFYPWSHLVRKAAAGDLFVCHIVKESRSLYDPARRLAKLGEAFRLRTSYEREIKKASDLGWYIAHHHEQMRGPVVSRRIAWCVRTILIARSAEQKSPVFGAKELVRFSGSEDVQLLISQKNQPHPSNAAIGLLRTFLDRHGLPDPHPEGNVRDYLATFRKVRNTVAQSTLRSSEPDDDYGG